MAIKGEITLDEIVIASVDADPSTAGGISLPPGSFALLDDDVGAKAWLKTGVTATDWTPLTVVDAALTGEPTGFPNRTDTTLSFDNGTRTLSVVPTGAFFDVYIQGKRIRTSTTLTSTIPNTEGLYFFYIDTNGALQYQTTFDISLFKDKVYTALVYWSVAQAKILGIGEERHGITMDWATHAHFHATIGSSIRSSDFPIGDFILGGDGSLATHAQVSIGNGTLTDEDIDNAIVNSASPAAPLEQVLSPIAQMEVGYRVGASGNWQTDTATNFPVKTGTRMQWNQFSAGTWSAVDATEGNYVAMWVFATNIHEGPVKALMGQRQDTTLDAAKTNNLYSTLDFGTLPAQEAKVLYRLIFQTSSAYANTPKARLVDIQDFRIGQDVNNSSSVLAFSDHGQLGGRGDDDHLQYLLLAGRSAGQIAYGGQAAAEILRLRSTQNASKGSVRLVDDGGQVGIGAGFITNAPTSLLHVDAGTGVASYLKFTANTTTGQTATDGFDLGIDATGNAEVRQRGNLSLLFYTNNTVAGRFDASQRFIVGADASQASSSTDQSRLQLHGLDAATSQLAIMRWSADTASGVLRFTKSRGASVGTHAAVVAGDFIGSASYRGSDGTNFITGATISAIIDGTVATNGMPTRLSFATTPVGGSASLEAMRIDSSGRVVVAPSGSPAIDVSGLALFPAFQILGNSPVTAQMLTASYSADTNPAVQNFLKSRNATIGSHAVVAADDEIGRIQFRASDGTNFELAASIRAFVDGTPGNDDMPGRLVFYTTPDGTNGIVERMRITQAGFVGIGNIVPTRQLDISDTLRVRGGSPSRGKSLSTPDTTGNANWTDSRDINREVHIQDDFTSQYDGGAGFLMGPAGWAIVLNGGLVTAAVSTNVNAVHRGIIEINANDNGDDPLIHLGVDDMLVGDGLIKIQWLVRSPDTLPTAGENWIARIGLGDVISSTSNDFVDGCYFEFGPSGTTTITTKTASNSTRTTNSSGVTLAVNTWYLLEMDITLTSVEFRINGNLVQTHVANIPTGAGRNCGPIAKISKTAGGADRILSIDAFRYSQYFDTNRY